MHRHSEVELAAVGHGVISSLFGRERRIAHPGEFCLLWGIIPHGATEVLEGHPIAISLRIPMAWFMKWNLPTVLMDRVLASQVLVSHQRLHPSSPFELMKHWYALLKENGREADEIVILEVQALLRQMGRTPLQSSRACSDLPETGVLRRPAGPFEKMAAEIAQRHCERLTINDVAQSANLSRPYAMRLFRKASGITINDYTVQYRVSTAQHLLATADRKLSIIAAESGFGSLSRFHTVFKRVCGQTPGQYRRSLRGTGTTRQRPRHL